VGRAGLGPPVEMLLTAIARREFASINSETRLVQVGESAGSTISLPAAVLRSTALTIMGTAGVSDRTVLVDALQRVLTHAAAGDLVVDTVCVPLADVENAWHSETAGWRIVIKP
jgi:hypothetical protein